MAMFTIIKLTNLTPMHIGTGRENYDFSASDLQSDTLSSALAALRAQQGKDKDLEPFLSSFTLSSAFPFVDHRYFLPKPQGKISVHVSDGEDYASGKKIKKLKYLEREVWQALMNGDEVSVSDAQIQKEFLLASKPSVENPYHKPFKSQVMQRVSIPREDDKVAEPFFFDWTYFSSESGLYCIVDAKGELLDEIVHLFKILGETGLGTDKNIGGGKFEVETDTLTITDTLHPNASMLLSLYIPTEEEISILDLDNSKYEILQRGGYLAGSQETDFRHLRKKSIYMFSVGSIFKTTQPLTGKVVDLKPDWNDDRMHSIFRSGKPFVIPIKIYST